GPPNGPPTTSGPENALAPEDLFSCSTELRTRVVPVKVFASGPLRVDMPFKKTIPPGPLIGPRKAISPPRTTRLVFSNIGPLQDEAPMLVRIVPVISELT